MNDPLSRRSTAERIASWLLGAAVIAGLLAVVGIMAIYMVPRGPAYVADEDFLFAAIPPLLVIVAVAINEGFAGRARLRYRRTTMTTLLLAGIPLLWVLIEFLHAQSLRP